MNRMILPICIACLLLLSGCNQAPVDPQPTDSVAETTPPTTSALPDGSVLATNLAEESVCAELDRLMEDCGISQPRRQVFWEHVTQFNQCQGVTGLQGAYAPLDSSQPGYDPYDLQDTWSAAHPEFIGYNCRITAFSLYGDFLTVGSTESPNATALFLDAQALEEDPSALMEEDDFARFLAFFSVVEGENTNDSARQAQLVQVEWERRGIRFREDAPVSQICLFVHNQYSPEENELLLGHTGVLLDSGEGLYFVEKLAFQAPYQVTKFQDRAALEAYLMDMYDTEWDQPTAKPFILENGKVLA